MYQLNDKIINLVPYEPISGTYKIRLDANECPTTLPDDIRGEIKAGRRLSPPATALTS